MGKRDPWVPRRGSHEIHRFTDRNCEFRVSRVEGSKSGMAPDGRLWWSSTNSASVDTSQLHSPVVHARQRSRRRVAAAVLAALGSVTGATLLAVRGGGFRGGEAAAPRSELTIRSASLVIRDLSKQWDAQHYGTQPFEFCGQKHLTQAQVTYFAERGQGVKRLSAVCWVREVPAQSRSCSGWCVGSALHSQSALLGWGSPPPQIPNPNTTPEQVKVCAENFLAMLGQEEGKPVGKWGFPELKVHAPTSRTLHSTPYTLHSSRWSRTRNHQTQQRHGALSREGEKIFIELVTSDRKLKASGEGSK